MRNEARQGERQRALAGAGWPDDEQELTRLELERQVAQRVGGRAGVAEAEVLGADRDRAGLPPG